MLLVFDGGPAVAGWNVNLMMLLGLIMSAVFLLIVFGPYAVPPHHRPQRRRRQHGPASGG